MQFSESQIKNFSKLYKDRFGKELERKVAFEFAEKLYRVIELTYKQVSETDYEELQKRRKQDQDLTIKK